MLVNYPAITICDKIYIHCLNKYLFWVWLLVPIYFINYICDVPITQLFNGLLELSGKEIFQYSIR